MHPATPHRGPWVAERSRFIFRVYCDSSDNMLDPASCALVAKAIAQSEQPPDTKTFEGWYLSEDTFVEMFGEHLANVLRLPLDHVIVTGVATPSEAPNAPAAQQPNNQDLNTVVR